MAETDLHRDPAEAFQAGHETSDLPPQRIAQFALAISIAMGFAVLVTSLLIHFRATEQAKREIAPPRLAKEREVVPQPRLETQAPQGLREMRAAEDNALSSYGWVDKDAGIVRIPIDRAMEILTGKGLPARPQAGKEQADTPNRGNNGAAH